MVLLCIGLEFYSIWWFLCWMVWIRCGRWLLILLVFICMIRLRWFGLLFGLRILIRWISFLLFMFGLILILIGLFMLCSILI